MGALDVFTMSDNLPNYANVICICAQFLSVNQTELAFSYIHCLNLVLL